MAYMIMISTFIFQEKSIEVYKYSGSRLIHHRLIRQFA